MDVRPLLGDDDRQWLAQLWQRRWGSDVMVVEGHVFNLSEVSALIALDGNRRVGAATWILLPAAAELVSLDSLEENQGVASLLLTAAQTTLMAAGVRAITLTTTNDNMRALGFFQRRGFRLVGLSVGAVDRARHQKPSIPIIGHQGIPLHDEIRLEKMLVSER